MDGGSEGIVKLEQMGGPQPSKCQGKDAPEPHCLWLLLWKKSPNLPLASTLTSLSPGPHLLSWVRALPLGRHGPRWGRASRVSHEGM